jgi:hypothetical protein
MLHVSISLTLAAVSFSGGRQIATSGSSTPRGGLKQLLARTSPGTSRGTWPRSPRRWRR